MFDVDTMFMFDITQLQKDSHWFFDVDTAFTFDTQLLPTSRKPYKINENKSKQVGEDIVDLMGDEEWNCHVKNLKKLLEKDSNLIFDIMVRMILLSSYFEIELWIDTVLIKSCFNQKCSFQQAEGQQDHKQEGWYILMVLFLLWIRSLVINRLIFFSGLAVY